MTLLSRLLLTVSTLSIVVVPNFAQDNPDVTSSELRHHVQFLASDSLMGRRAGERGNEIAAEYIAKEFERYGLASPPGGYLQQFPFIATVRAGKNNSLSISSGESSWLFHNDKDVRPLAFSSDTTLRSGLVFAGYGITDTASKYDDYQGIDVRGKIVIVLRHSPDTSSIGKFSKYTSMRVKALTAREHGAAGLLLVTGPLDEAIPKLYPLSYDRGMGTAGIAAMSMTWTALDSLFRENGKDLRTVQQQIMTTQSPLSFEFPEMAATMQSEIVKIIDTTANVLGYLEGTDPALAQELVILGAHMDHLGLGGEGSLRPDTVAIHFGADDNASGISGLLEAAQYFAAHRFGLKRSMLFIAFSAEELGLLGSDYYVKHPFKPLTGTIAMLNMDMIGRLNNRMLVVEGISTSPGFDSLVRSSIIDSSLLLKLKPDGFGPSDHSSFYMQKIPVLFFFTNLHEDYHRPSDTWDKLNYSGEEAVVRLVTRIATSLTNVVERPPYVQAAPSTTTERREVRVSLGVIPDYAEDLVGMKISGTRPGSAAEKAGLIANDIIIKFGGREVKNIYDFTHLLGECKPGERVEIVVRRGNEEKTLVALLLGR